MNRVSYIRFATYAVVVAIAVLATRPANRVIDVGLAENGYDFAVRSLLKRSLKNPHDSVFLSEKFPELKPVVDLPEGLTWKFADARDFYVWRATAPSGTNSIGIYFGTAPNFEGDISMVEVGQVGKEPVVWCVTKSAKDGIHYECMFIYLHDRESIPLQLHVWVYAESEEALGHCLTALRTLTFEKREMKS